MHDISLYWNYKVRIGSLRNWCLFSFIVLLGTPETTHTDPQKNIEENASAIEAKGASNEVTDLDTCSNNVETPLADPKNEQETQLLLAEFSC